MQPLMRIRRIERRSIHMPELGAACLRSFDNSGDDAPEPGDKSFVAVVGLCHVGLPNHNIQLAAAVPCYPFRVSSNAASAADANVIQATPDETRNRLSRPRNGAAANRSSLLSCAPSTGQISERRCGCQVERPSDAWPPHRGELGRSRQTVTAGPR